MKLKVKKQNVFILNYLMVAVTVAAATRGQLSQICQQVN